MDQIKKLIKKILELPTRTIVALIIAWAANFALLSVFAYDLITSPEKIWPLLLIFILLAAVAGVIGALVLLLFLAISFIEWLKDAMTLDPLRPNRSGFVWKIGRVGVTGRIDQAELLSYYDREMERRGESTEDISEQPEICVGELLREGITLEPPAVIASAVPISRIRNLLSAASEIRTAGRFLSLATRLSTLYRAADIPRAELYLSGIISEGGQPTGVTLELFRYLKRRAIPPPAVFPLGIGDSITINPYLPVETKSDSGILIRLLGVEDNAAAFEVIGQRATSNQLHV